jgi:ATP-dependent Clp protease ATP-binding subunit ClpA
MLQHVRSAQKESADVGDLIAAVYEERHAYACMLLEEYGIERVDVLEAISHRDDDSFADESQSDGALQKYAINLIAQAKKGKIDPVIGRLNEIERSIQTLCRRKKNNPLLIGEPGVGKTAIAEGLALKIVPAMSPNCSKMPKFLPSIWGRCLPEPNIGGILRSGSKR